MDLQDAQGWLVEILNEFSIQFQRVPGSAIFLRYVKSSYQNDPVRSAVELFLFLFAVRYLLAPTYSTQKKSYVTLSEEVGARSVLASPATDRLTDPVQEIDELVEDWTPEPLVPPQTAAEAAENEKRPVIVG
jgi:serine palmitoyltransferase